MLGFDSIFATNLVQHWHFMKAKAVVNTRQHELVLVEVVVEPNQSSIVEIFFRSFSECVDNEQT